MRMSSCHVALDKSTAPISWAVERTARQKNVSVLIPEARKIEFESCLNKQ